MAPRQLRMILYTCIYTNLQELPRIDSKRKKFAQSKHGIICIKNKKEGLWCESGIKHSSQTIFAFIP
jgi:hypothetical protein